MTTHIPQLTLPHSWLANPASSILLPIILGGAVGVSAQPSEVNKFYLAIKQPPLRPPPQIFGPVWTVLYGLMGYAAHRVALVIDNPLSTPAAVQLAQECSTLYTLQLGLNLAWMPLFFTLKRPIEATVDIVALLGLNVYLTYAMGTIDSTAGWCMAPYAAWLCFATYLCAGAGYLNGWHFPGKASVKEVKEQ